MTTPQNDNRAEQQRQREEIEYTLSGIGPRRQAFNEGFVHFADNLSLWLRRHWLGLVNGILAAYIGLAVAVPIGFAAGLTGPASAVFRAYRFACDELPTHSLFIGGYQICLCQRCLAIYTSMLLFGLGLAYVRSHRPIRSISWQVWLLSMLPMALDGGTQFFGWRESNVWLRLLTGIIFGIGTGWFMLAHIEEAASDEPLPAVAPAQH